MCGVRPADHDSAAGASRRSRPGLPPPARRRRRPGRADADSGGAIAAGYAGLFALIPFLAPVALVLGILAIRDLKKNPDKHGMGRAIFGVTMGIFFTLFFTLALVLYLVVSSPGFIGG